MDDIVDASNDVTTLIKTKGQVDELLGQFGFEIKTWYRNSPELGTVIDNTKVLGLTWNIGEDSLKPLVGKTKDKKWTKRRMLSRISEIWDPLGLCAGVLMTGKLLFQSVVRLKPGWDDSLKKYRKIIDKWNIWLEEMDNCKDIVISRSVIPSEFVLGPTLKCEVVGFSDGSSLGFGCVLYLRWSDEHESKIDVKFLCAKGKVGSIGGNTVPRNELWVPHPVPHNMVCNKRI